MELKKNDLFFTILTVAICGAVVMEIEILGSRILSPYFGVSLFVWTSLITITLLSLSLGYYFGGKIADKYPNEEFLALIVALSGISLVFIPLLRGYILKLTSNFEIRLGALISAFILFSPSLFLLGSVTPFAVKLILKKLEDTGKTVGKLSAISTVGSFLGTLLTGFFVIPYFHIDTIVIITAIVLIVLAFFLYGKGLFKVLLFLFFSVALLFLKQKPIVEVRLPNGIVAKIVAQEESFYGRVSVVDFFVGKNVYREMLIDGIIQGGIDLKTKEPIYPYTYYLEQSAIKFNPTCQKALVIGLGAGNIPSRLSRYGLKGTSVEIDPLVAEMAKRYFFYDETSFDIVVEDGRSFLQRTKKKYDVIFLDAFSAENEPSHLFTLECFLRVKSLLNEGGIFCINISGGSPLYSNRKNVDKVLNTLCKVFKETLAFYSKFEKPDDLVNYTLIAGSNLKPKEKREFLPIHPLCREYLSNFFENVYLPSGKEKGLYTDGASSMEIDSAKEKLKLRVLERSLIPLEILLN